ncbi:MAG: F0F1 ATP synthase subunit A [Elusimicrobia bacterium]|nr:F0F1 ATP synthase subunit A [Elusimicrobiota bacterium]MBP9128333.1 F0F1 ATP synthase subunit A [Elusimicrobiota bacterium]MBP9698811.1 F0F1 ATP synthase subunit A [Elusimicrobiota bacterium]
MNFVHTLEHHLLDHVYSHVSAGPLSFRFSKHLLVMWIAAAVAAASFVAAGQMARRGKRNRWVLFVESLAVFVRDDIVLPNLGEEGRAYLPYFLSTFFFILLMNLMGLVPGSATPTGNISVTAALAVCTFFMINVAGVREHGFGGYVKSLVPHGMPVWLLPLMYPIELLGLLTKTFALCIRLFANMIAGHIVILAFLALIFLFEKVWVAPLSVSAALGISLLELFVAFLQAYIFTLLSAIFVGGAVHSH